MDGTDRLLIVGLSQRTAPVVVREAHSLDPSDAARVLREFCDADGISEAFVLSTCNRTEVLVACDDPHAAEAHVRSTLFALAKDDQLYAFRGVHAVMHLFRVASGLDSMVVGETEILGQIKRALQVAQEHGAARKTLQPLLTQSLVVGKRARKETTIGDGSLSVARVGLEVAARALGKFEGRDAVVVGAGETGQLAAKYLSAEGVRRIAVVNRTVERATQLAAELGSHCEAFGLERMAREVVGANIAVVCVDGGEPLIGVNTLDRKALARRDEPLVLLDLSVPRAVDPAVSDFDGVLVYDLDALLPIVDEHREGRDAAAEAVATILVAEVHKYLSLRTYAQFTPSIKELEEGFRRERESLIDAVTDGAATPRELELAHELEKRLLSLALVQLKESARRARSEEALDREYRRFVDEIE